MRGFKSRSARLTIACVCMSLTCSGLGLSTPQKDTLCTETKVVQQSCDNFGWLNPERKNPFIAERLVTTFTTDESIVQLHHETELVARDATGRIRLEYHISTGPTGFPSTMALGGIPSSQHDLNVDGQDELMGKLRVIILDCFGGEKIQLTPSAHIAIVQQACVDVSKSQPSEIPFSEELNQLLTTGNRADTVEDLGHKQQALGILQPQPLELRGLKVTWLGKECDGDWKGKPIAAWELWMSDEIGAIILWTTSDFRKRAATRYTLQNIRREDPDNSLFSVPSGYKVTVW
jgi:hypothetical protein